MNKQQCCSECRKVTVVQTRPLTKGGGYPATICTNAACECHTTPAQETYFVGGGGLTVKSELEFDEPHETKDGYCCACDYDIAVFERLAEEKLEKMYIEAYNAAIQGIEGLVQSLTVSKPTNESEEKAYEFKKMVVGETRTAILQSLKVIREKKI